MMWFTLPLLAVTLVCVFVVTRPGLKRYPTGRAGRRSRMRWSMVVVALVGLASAILNLVLNLTLR
ncbi:hypothetical protein SCB71_14505 [Herbiconiux sp. KACC 21604]|uniref:hypothetical protein n=1 Tax=unclassified Herbiconiux TaxID=2618217 RepID=UPI001492D3C4|nr:hypothetical protein [Herbiconiux sp. SALV-R1]QJU54354.1 hypothetical protein HL652_12445 [Herbiconiux sp. SALV-R1]WPO85424.1 hypothetical protein SCB71_14505 [Herbiconiux sp. KACC 21604]